MYAHTPTMYLMAVAVAVGLALALSVATLVPIGSRKREGMLLWALGLVLYALTYVLYGLRGQVSDFFSIVVGNSALSAGLAMLTHALLVFQQREWPPWRIWVALTIQNGLRAQDVAGRMGDEEFLVLLPHATTDETLLIAERLRQSIPAVDCFKRCDLQTTISVSVGAAQFDPVRHAGGDELIHDADQALYRAKERGRNRVELSSQSASADTGALA